MNGWTLAQIAELCGGRLENADGPQRVCPFGAVAIDTRTIRAGGLFVAIRAARDGHRYLREAVEQGAIAALVDEQTGLDRPPDLPLILVPDTIRALQRWAAAHRASLSAELFVVTGSSGKTTTKDRIAEVLSSDGPTHRTQGNRNNHLGVPLTLLGLRPEHRWAVVEVAMNRPGEITPLARLCRPRHVVLTTIGWAHVGAFGSREAILAEKLGALSALETGGTFFHESDRWLTENLPAEARGLRRRTFGLDREADCHPDSIEWDLVETRFATAHTGPVRYPCPGPGACKAALAAILVAGTVGIPGEEVRRALVEARPRALRMEPRPLGEATALLDCYNASPESSLAAIGFLLDLPLRGRRLLAFGEMRELGEESVAAHRMVGKAAVGLDGVYLLGSDCRHALEAFREAGGTGFARIYDRHGPLGTDLAARLERSDTVLFKGSRASEMEKAYEICKERIAGKGA